MDFIPAGYITLRTAVDRILRATHGDEWGRQEITLEKNEITVPGAIDENDQLIKRRPYDREAVALVRQQVRNAEEIARTVLVAGELVAEMQDGPPIPQDYWKSAGAGITLNTGNLQLGDGVCLEDRQWQHHRVLLKIKEFDTWLTGEQVDTKKPQQRRHDAEHDTVLRNKIKTVLAVAKRRWPRPDQIPGRNQMARLLAANVTLKKNGYKESTLRKILGGSYSASRRLKLPGYPDIDIRKK